MSKKGFTLIELLIVIALLGALAVGLLAAIDPLEQFRKGSDTSVRSIASELHQGIIRSYASLSRMPWDTDNSAQYINAFADTNVVRTNVIQQVINVGELKSNFAEVAGEGKLSRIWVAGQDGGDDTNPLNPQVIVCYRPESRSQRCDPNTVFTVDTTAIGISSVSRDTTTCNSTNCGNTNYNCYWCIGDVPVSTP